MLMLIRRLCSSGSVSRMLVPSSTLPRRLVAPTRWSRVSTSVVLPEPPCPVTATFRIRSGATEAICATPLMNGSGHSIQNDVRPFQVVPDQAPEGRERRQTWRDLHQDDPRGHARG